MPDQIIAADIDETPCKKESPSNYVTRLAEAKARAIAVEHPQAYILAADTAVACSNNILGKAETALQAQTYITALSGRRHQVHTGVALYTPNTTIVRSVKTTVAMKRLTKKEIEVYLASEEWQGKAGGYAIQGLAAAFIKSINGSYTNVVGLPLYETRNLLIGVGYGQ